MIRKTFLIFIFLIFTAQLSFAVKTNRYDKIQAIENKFEVCIETSKSTKEKTKCHTNTTNEYNIEIGNIIKDIKTLISQSQYETLIKSEEQWKDYYNKYVLFLNNSIKQTDENILLIESLKHNIFYKHAFLLDYGLYSLIMIKYYNR